MLGALGKIRKNGQLAADGQQPPFYRWRRIAAIFRIEIEAFPFPFGVARLARIPSTRCLILLVGLESVRHGSSRGGTCEPGERIASDQIRWNSEIFTNSCPCIFGVTILKMAPLIAFLYIMDFYYISMFFFILVKLFNMYV